MQAILTILRKEFLDILRDRRTLMVMVLVPLLVTPLLVVLITRLQAGQAEKAMHKKLRIGLVAHSEAPGLRAYLEQAGATVLPFESLTEFKTVMKQDSLDACWVVPPTFATQIQNLKSDSLKIYTKGSDEYVSAKVKGLAKGYREQMKAQRLDSLHLPMEAVEPVVIAEGALESSQEEFGKAAGGFLPYLFIIYCFMGCMYPAIDLFTGEKERFTLETILTMPVQRLHILLGKLSVVALSGLITAVLAVLGLFIGVRYGLGDMITGTDFGNIVSGLLSVRFILAMMVMILPLAVFFASVMAPLAMWAKNFKEAQSMITPLNFLVVIPAVIAMMPGMELNLGTALIPIVNIVLAFKDIVAGTAQAGLLVLVIGELLLMAGLALWFCTRRFGAESNILRN